MTHESVVHVRPGRAGFTLIEVLIAAFIIALGVLGLLALFAGAARQQQAASQTTVSVMAARNAEAVLARNFGALRTPPNMSTLFTESVWYPLPMDAVKHYLTVNPGGGSDGPYFLVPPTTPMPYSLFQDQGLTFGSDPGFSNGAPDGPYTAMTDFGQRRIDPDSLNITVTYLNDNDAPLPVAVTYSRQPGVAYSLDAPGVGQYTYTPGGEPGAEVSNTLVYNPNGVSVPSPAYPDYIVVDVQADPNGSAPARVFAMNLATVQTDPTIKVGGIAATSYKWRNDQLVSLSDRLYVRSDSSAPGGRRPFLSYSVLYRRTASASQMAVFTYELIAPSGSARYVPKERLQDLTAGDAPLRRASVELRFDTGANRYYIQVANADAWVVEPGQILLVEGRQTPSATPTPIEDLGSDLPVQVIRKSRGSGSTWRGDLDRSPRAGGGSFLDPQQRIGGGKQDLTVFAVNDVVTSEADGSRWRLKPLEARMFQILNTN